MTTVKTVHSDNVELATQAFGDPSNEPVLLIMGAMASMLWWPDEFCRRLADAGRYVIRYDNRDTGLSTTYEVGNPPHSFDDMADDAGRVLDAYKLAKAHIVGMSMGGMLAQVFAIRHPDRVKTLTAISTSPVGTDTSHLPGTSPEYVEHSNSGATVDWSDRAQVIDFMLSDSRAIAGTAFPFNEGRMRTFIERDYDRAKNFAAATNHFSVKGGEEMTGRLANVTAPLLVIHGTADPIFPIEHGAALAGSVKSGRLVRLEGGGHELHPGHWDTIVGEIAANK